jgi:hypothetical protein
LKEKCTVITIDDPEVIAATPTDMEMVAELMLRTIAKEYGIIKWVVPPDDIEVEKYPLDSLTNRIRDEVYRKEHQAFVRFSYEYPGLVYVGRVIGQNLLIAGLQWPFTAEDWHKALESLEETCPSHT